jgi:hypothetical protein
VTNPESTPARTLTQPKRKSRTATEALARKVDTTSTPDGCHRFTGAHDRGGYGRIWAEGIWYLPHRLAWSLAHGPIPQGMRVCHTCDQPDCCRVDHLFLGTAKDNTADMVAKGRGKIGMLRLNAKLDPDKVREIRRLHSEGLHPREIAPRFGVHFMTIRYVVRGLTWRDVA